MKKMTLKKWLKMSAVAGALLATNFVLTPVYATLTPIPMSVNQSKYYDAEYRITRIAVANPAIADVTPVGDREFLIVAKSAGTTTLYVWTENGMFQDFEIQVGNFNNGSATLLQQAIGIPTITVEQTDKGILLSGTVKNQQERDLALRMAELQVGKDAVIDMLTMTEPSQINLEVQIVEISHSDAKDLGFQWMTPLNYEYTPAREEPGNFPGAPPKKIPPTLTGAQGGTPGIFVVGQGHNTVNAGRRGWVLSHLAPVNVQLQALVTSGKARVLSRPNVTTLSGEKAKIHIGGKIPIPVRDKDSTTIEWKDYGIDLQIQPTVDTESNVTTAIVAKVSDLDYSNAIKTEAGTYPALRDREAEAKISIPSGSTMMIGGLINSQDAETITKVPILGDIPIIGEFFKHRSNSKTKRELVILVRPILVEGMTPVGLSPAMNQYRAEEKKSEEDWKPIDPNNPPTSPTEETEDTEK